jgi:N6-adenosine-specific RNA methylase IME4
MATYNDLSAGNYYVIQEIENTTLELVYVSMVTEKCVLVEYQDDDQTLTWYRKTDEIFEVVEQLTEEQAIIYENLFENDDEDDDYFWGDDDDDDDEEFWDVDDDDDDDDDDDEKIIAIKN